MTTRLKSNYSVEVFTTPLRVTPYQGTESSLLRRVYLDPTSLQFNTQTKKILSNLSSFPPDILYPVNNGWQSILAKKFCLQHKTKLLLAGHSGPGWDDRVNLWLCPNAFITFSQAQAEWARGVTKKVPVHVIPHAIDTNQFQPGKSPLKLNLPKPIFISVAALKQGRGETHKNIKATIEAIDNLKKGSLLLIGDGPDAERIDGIANYKLSAMRYKRITVSHNVINQYYRAADVFTLASSASEAFGISYLEALASNLPVVTTDDNLRHEIIGPAGVYIKDPNNVTEYSRGLQKAMDTKWSNLPRIQAQKYSWDKIIPQYKNLFDSLIS